MNNQIKDALEIVSKIFPLSFSYSDSQYDQLQFATSERNQLISEPESKYEWVTGKDQDSIRIGIATIQKNQANDVDVLKLTSTQNGSLRKLSMLIDLKKLNVKISEPDHQPEKLLANNKYISAYLNLSQREKQITKCLAKMQTSEEIGNQLFISTHTVKNHRKNIRKKINFCNREDYSLFLNWVRGFVS